MLEMILYFFVGSAAVFGLLALFCMLDEAACESSGHDMINTGGVICCRKCQKTLKEIMGEI